MVPTLYSSAWKAQDGSLGIVMANISDHEREIGFILDPARYELPKTGKVTIITSQNEPVVLQDYNETTTIKFNIPERSTLVISIR